MSAHTFQISSDQIPVFKTFLQCTIRNLERWSDQMDAELESPHTDDKYLTVIKAVSAFQEDKLILQSVLEQIEKAAD